LFSQALGENLREESLSPGYFFYGEETYPAERFVRDLQALLIPPDAGDFRPDLFYLDETKWADILDTARTMPFLFSPLRIIVVRVPEKKPDSDKSGEKEAKLVSEAEEKLLKAYFASPPSRTLMVVILPGKIRKGHPLVRVFSSLPGVVAKELKPLRQDRIRPWMEEKARSVGKALTTDAALRLLEIVGCDMRRMENEIEKLAVYVDDKKTIDAADVNRATAWVREFESYELGDALEKANLRECLIVLDNLFKAGEKPVDLLRQIVGFFRNILMAQTQLREKSADKKAIFKQLFPFIQETYRKLYPEKYAGFFSLVEGIRPSDLAAIFEDLENVDVRIKSSDAEAQRLFEVFLYKYCRLRKKAGVTSKAWG
jgi:DNA polymerase-3 subunit delta